MRKTLSTCEDMRKSRKTPRICAREIYCFTEYTIMQQRCGIVTAKECRKGQNKMKTFSIGSTHKILVLINTKITIP